MKSVRLADITKGSRHRKDLGDIKGLADSIEAIGLLHPIVIRPDNRLVVGERRLEAFRLLGRDAIPANVATTFSDLATFLRAEADENTCRKALNPVEGVAIGKAIEKAYRPVAKASQSQSPGRPKKGGGTSPTFSKRDESSRTTAVAASAAGVDRTTYEKAKAVVESGNDEAITHMAKTGKVDGAYKKVKKAAAEEDQKKAAAKAKRAIRGTDENGIFHGDSFALAGMIPDASCPLIFTDPPYDRLSLPLFSSLGELADRILIEGGSLLTYCGQYVLQEVIDLVLEGRDMRWFWVVCCQHSGNTAEMREYGIKVKWKPILWFVKGQFRRDRSVFVDDLVVSQQEKDTHPWQQSVIEASYYIENLSAKGDLVVDPFCGGGTTAKAAKSLGRQWWTADIEATHVLNARKRLNDADV